MSIKRFSIILMCLFFNYNCMTYANPKVKRCEVRVTYHYKTGYKRKKVYKLYSKSQSDCFNKKRLYQENSAPLRIARKEVVVKWK